MHDTFQINKFSSSIADESISDERVLGQVRTSVIQLWIAHVYFSIHTLKDLLNVSKARSLNSCFKFSRPAVPRRVRRVGCAQRVLPERHLQLGIKLLQRAAGQPQHERRRRRDLVLEEPALRAQLPEVRIYFYVFGGDVCSDPT